MVLRRELTSRKLAGWRCLETLIWPGAFGYNALFFLGKDAFDPTSFAEFAPGAEITDLQEVDGCHIVSARFKADPDIPGATAEPEPFDGLNTLLALRHSETPGQVREWLDYHCAHHNAQAALIFDRSGDAEAQTALADALGDMSAPAMIVTAPIPLGLPGRPALGSAAMAPRAKRRKVQAEPWRAPLADGILYEVLRRRFLTRAGAVLALDPCDYLCEPGGDVDAFSFARGSEFGMVPVLGEAVFPWRVRKGAEATLGDHICRTRPAAVTTPRWIAAPRRLDAGNIWLPNRIVNALHAPDEVLRFERAMAIQFPGVDVPALVNKDLLDADPRLIERSRALGHKPVEPPSRPPAPVKLAQPRTERVAIVTCMKNEGPFILEWLAYHRMIGVDDFLVYSNDCDDGTDRLLDLLQEKGLLEHRQNPFRQTGAKPQHAALAAAAAEPVIANAGWIVAMDVDEFISVHVGAGRLPDLFAAVPDASLISMTWRLFGNSDIDGFSDAPVTGQFTRCAPELIRRPHQAWGFKTLFRNERAFEGIGVHRPRGYLGGEPRWVNGSGKPMPERYYRTGWRSGMDSWGYDLVTLNHYAVRSTESFLVKRERGRVNHVARDQGAAYWFRMNNNDVLDHAIQRHLPGLRAGIAAMLGDAEIAAAHTACVAAHRERIRALRARPDYAQLFDALTGERMKRLSRLHRHFGMNVFLQGPDAVPDALLNDELAPDYFFNVDRPERTAE